MFDWRACLDGYARFFIIIIGNILQGTKSCLT